MRRAADSDGSARVVTGTICSVAVDMSIGEFMVAVRMEPSLIGRHYDALRPKM